MVRLNGHLFQDAVERIPGLNSLDCKISFQYDYMTLNKSDTEYLFLLPV